MYNSSNVLQVKKLIFSFSLMLSLSNVFAQQQPVNSATNSAPIKNISSITWEKNSDDTYKIYNEEGRKLDDFMFIGALKTDTLAVLHKSSRSVLLMPDFYSASSNINRKGVVLAKNVSKDFYITNPKSYITFINDEDYIGEATNVNGDYVIYISDLDKTYLEKDIRGFSNWGAKNITDLGYAPENTFWYRNVSTESYGIIKRGETIDYSLATPKKDGNNLVVTFDGKIEYTLENYYSASAFVMKPVKIRAISENETNTKSGCVQGDCLNGWGKWEFADGAYYDGFWENGKRHNYGLYMWAEGGKYIGNWDTDNMSGYGVYIAKNEDNIIGNYKNGNLNGFGISVKSGTWSQGVYENGTLITPYDFYDNGVDIGCTAGDCQNKYGRMEWSNGDSYTGFFKNGKLYMGTYNFASGERYTGTFNESNQFHGTGRYFFNDNSYYGGEWKNGKYDGKGYFHDKDINQKIGIWSKGTLIKSYK